MKFKIAVTNVTNNIGAEIINYLSKIPHKEVIGLGESHELGKTISFGNEKVLSIKSLAAYDFSDTDIIFLLYLNSAVSNKYKIKALKAGKTVIDFSHESAFEVSTANLIPSVNDREFLLNYKSKKIISLPIALSTQLAFILKPLDIAYSIKRVVVSTYQAVSNEGDKKAMDELYYQTKGIYENKRPQLEVFPRKISFNVIPQVGEIENNTSEEEKRIVSDLRKLIKKDLNISVNAAYVPVFIGNSAYINIEFHQSFELPKLKKILSETKEILLLDRNQESYFTPSETVGEEAVLVSKIKRDTSTESAVSMWSCCDNLKRGAAMTAVEIAQFLASNPQLMSI